MSTEKNLPLLFLYVEVIECKLRANFLDLCALLSFQQVSLAKIRSEDE
jgi:hypothetical protein